MYHFHRTLCLFFSFLPFCLPAQQSIRCSTVYMDSLRRAQHPEIGSQEDFERWLAPRMQQMQQSTQQRVLITIPVVVHIVHDNESVDIGRNISQAQVVSQIAVLNEDFRREFGTPGYNPAGADVEIEFCLATIDPNGAVMPEPGIDRIDRNTFANWPVFPWSLTTVETFVMPFTIWDPEEYLNIYVVELSGNNLGYAQFPDTDSIQGLPTTCCANTDAVTINYTNFGRTGNVQAPYNKGRTTTHEVGHWLGLLHIWGDGDCSEDDFCNDTPAADQANYGCPVNPISCGNPNMFENYMDYTDDSCMNIFTNCQALRMRTVMNYAPRRNSLLTSNACSQTVAPAPDFSANFTTACEGSSISFQDLSNNATSWTWTFEGGIPAMSTDQNPQIVYPNAGTYKVSLVASNQYGSNTLERSNYITITSSGLSTFFLEDFESGLGSWTIENPDNSITWERKQVGGTQSGSVGVWLNAYDYTSPGQRDELVSPVLNFSTQASIQLEFDHAYRAFSNSEKDSLLIYASTDGGSSWPFLLAAYGENDNGSFATGPEFISKFIPAATEDWCYAGSGWSSCKLVDLSAFEGEENFRFKFVSVNDYGNCIWVDNIELAGVCSPLNNIEPGLTAGVDFAIYPNPVQDISWLELPVPPGQNARLRILNLLGQPLFSQRLKAGTDSYPIDWSGFPAGTYVIEVGLGERLGYQRVIRLK